jgi:hypothetical protein
MQMRQRFRRTIAKFVKDGISLRRKVMEKTSKNYVDLVFTGIFVPFIVALFLVTLPFAALGWLFNRVFEEKE